MTADLPTSELVKVAANAFLAIKISLINAMAEVCEIVDADVAMLSRALGYDDRIGKRFLNAGLGFGGGCLPKDIRAFSARAVSWAPPMRSGSCTRSTRSISVGARRQSRWRGQLSVGLPR